MHTCMYVYMYVYMYACMYVCMHAWAVEPMGCRTNGLSEYWDVTRLIGDLFWRNIPKSTGISYSFVVIHKRSA